MLFKIIALPTATYVCETRQAKGTIFLQRHLSRIPKTTYTDHIPNEEVLHCDNMQHHQGIVAERRLRPAHMDSIGWKMEMGKTSYSA